MANETGDRDLDLIRSLIRAYPDYPKPGILFRDIFPVFSNAQAAEMLFSRLQAHIQRTHGANVQAIVGLEARGFLFGPLLAARMGCAFVPIRKRGKLPGKVETVSYAKEYGVDEFDIQADALTAGMNVILVDDLLATGGTFVAGRTLCERLGARVVDCLCVIELDGLGGRAALAPTRVSSLMQY